MSKPIALLYLPYTFDLGRDNTANDLMRSFNGWDGNMPRDGIRDYLWLCFTKREIDAPELQVFHPNAYTEAQYEELKSLVLENLKEKCTSTNL